MQPTTSNPATGPMGQVTHVGLKYYNQVVGTKTITLVKTSSTTYMAHVVN